MKNTVLIILSSLLIGLFAGKVSAQNEEDVLRYSAPQLIGTARYMGLGGAYGAVGADFSSLSSNPAGIGLYKRSDFSITPMLKFGNIESSYQGRTGTDSKNNFALGNVGFVLNFETSSKLDSRPFRNFQLGFGNNRITDFNNKTYIQGVNSQNSLLDTYLIYAGNKNPENLYAFDTRLAFDTYLIDTVPGEPIPTYVNAYSYIGGFTSALQRKSIETEGSMNEWVISGGMNVNEQLYFGVTFGFPRIRYYQESTYNEVNQTEPNRDLDQFSYYEELETTGTGVNIKIGTIFRPLDWIRIGAAYHSPTWFNDMNDRWSTRMTAYYTNSDQFSAYSPIGEYSYDIKTPSKFLGSLALFFGNNGLVSADYEYVNYGNGRLGPNIDFSTQNEVIKNNFDAASNFRVGTEWRVGLVQLRGGYAHYASPFKSGINDGEIQHITAGLGYRGKQYYMDAALVYSLSEMDYFLYGSNLISPVPTAVNTQKNYNFLLTIGYKFD